MIVHNLCFFATHRPRLSKTYLFTSMRSCRCCSPGKLITLHKLRFTKHHPQGLLSLRKLRQPPPNTLIHKNYKRKHINGNVQSFTTKRTSTPKCTCKIADRILLNTRFRWHTALRSSNNYLRERELEPPKARAMLFLSSYLLFLNLCLACHFWVLRILCWLLLKAGLLKYTKVLF